MDMDHHDHDDIPPESLPRGSETGPASVPPAESMITVQTNNFHRVLDYFDNDGDLIDENRTQFSIPCAICQLNDLSFTNLNLEEREDVTYEHYAVLRHCGHAFGYKCITHYLFIVVHDANHNELSCPLCRQPVACERGHMAPLDIYGGTTNMDVFRQQIREIRELLANPTCEVCLNSPRIDFRDAAHNSPRIGFPGATRNLAPIGFANAAHNRPPTGLPHAAGNPQLTQFQTFVHNMYMQHLESQSEAISAVVRAGQFTNNFMRQVYDQINRPVRPLPAPLPQGPLRIDNVFGPPLPPQPTNYRPATIHPMAPGHIHRPQPINQRNNRAVTFPSMAPGNNEDQTREPTTTFGYPFVQSPEHSWEL